MRNFKQMGMPAVRETKTTGVQTVVIFFILIFWITACSKGPVQTPDHGPAQQVSQVSSSDRDGYAIQVGAFDRKDRADRYIDQLQSQGVEAYAVHSDNGLWTVRAGGFASVSKAHEQAKILIGKNIIHDYFIVNAAEKEERKSAANLEDRILKTAKGYLGVRYKWGGTSAKVGFDCSGFTLAVFRQHGISLPRSSSRQFQFGQPVAKKDLKKGDLVFFATGLRNRISHVGIYTGKGQFIHASTSDKCIRMADMSKDYYKKRYRGARRVIQSRAG